LAEFADGIEITKSAHRRRRRRKITALNRGDFFGHLQTQAANIFFGCRKAELLAAFQIIITQAADFNAKSLFGKKLIKDKLALLGEIELGLGLSGLVVDNFQSAVFQPVDTVDCPFDNITSDFEGEFLFQEYGFKWRRRRIFLPEKLQGFASLLLIIISFFLILITVGLPIILIDF